MTDKSTTIIVVSLWLNPFFPVVMAGLVPAIHVGFCASAREAWMPGSEATAVRFASWR